MNSIKLLSKLIEDFLIKKSKLNPISVIFSNTIPILNILRNINLTKINFSYLKILNKSISLQTSIKSQSTNSIFKIDYFITSYINNFNSHILIPLNKNNPIETFLWNISNNIITIPIKSNYSPLFSKVHYFIPKHISNNLSLFLSFHNNSFPKLKSISFSKSILTLSCLTNNSIISSFNLINRFSGIYSLNLLTIFNNPIYPKYDSYFLSFSNN